jgi:hypothetical protein
MLLGIVLGRWQMKPARRDGFWWLMTPNAFLSKRMLGGMSV